MLAYDENGAVGGPAMPPQMHQPQMMPPPPPQAFNNHDPFFHPQQSLMAPMSPEMSQASGINSPPSVVSFVNSPSNGNPLGSPSSGPETPPPAYSPQEEPKYAIQLQQQDQVQHMDTTPCPSNNNLEPRQPPAASSGENSIQPIEYMEPKCWCSIAYYELNSRVGEPYHAESPDITVDGYTNPTMRNNTSFCLGQLSNVNRNSTIENTRRHIGKGVHLRYAEGKVYAHCISDKAIFVQSKICNYAHNFDPITVCKIPPNCSLVIFDMNVFAELLRQRAQKDYKSVFELTEKCTIR